MTTPDAFNTPDFEPLLAEYIQHVIEYVTVKKPELAGAITEALSNEGELLTQVIEALILKRIAEKREDNHQAMQMFRKFVTDSDMVDLLALQYNLKRQVLEAADDSVYPPKPAVMESDQELLRRFDLAPYQFHTTGTRKGYQFHALTLGERPKISMHTEPDTLIVRYDFPKELAPQRVKDAQARMLTPHSGKVDVAILSREGDGTASDALLNRVSDYLNRDDIAQESDQLTTRSAVIKPYRIVATLYTGADPLHHVTTETAEKVATEFADRAHRLGGHVDRLKIGEVLYGLDPKRVSLTEPAADIECGWDEAPHCTEVIIHVSAD
ncbi:baseplate J/gp47 family protein [Veronia pacifica]|uniref:Baseplate J protein n=1 Tax=Veronia pacifica TaxID=1080227 RepID=A0A1C3E9A8_9GAMM|nr:baseplate J/gp47 family protein [Veronia pacifica]ODA29858.1 baseplate J protein [Veronia pacifica]